MQRRLQLPNLAFRGPSVPPKQMVTGNHTISLTGGTKLPQTPRFNQLWKWYKSGVSALPAIRDVQSSDWSSWNTGRNRPRRNVARHNRSRGDDGVIANGHAGKDRCRTTDPDVNTKTNWCSQGWTRRLRGMVVRVENRHQVPNQAIVTDFDAVSGHDRGPSVDEDARPPPGSIRTRVATFADGSYPAALPATQRSPSPSAEGTKC
jgi:hypothetical protein